MAVFGPHGPDLLVTVDNGIASIEGVAHAKACGLDVLVTDHHLPGCDLPAGAVQINPRQPVCSYPYPHLAAAGLALKLATALAARCGRPLDLAALLRIACLGTIADLVPLTGENRVIAALGLEALGTARSQGLKALIRQSGMKPPFTAADVGFRLGPRLNAAGRLHTPDRALELLMSRDPVRALELALELDGWNRQRQEEETRVVDEARRELLARTAPGSALPAVLVAWSPAWHKGVVGIAAGRLAKELHRPTLLLSVEGETATGSGRSIPGIELHGFLNAWKDRLVRFGGHAQAVGMTVELERLDGLRREWEEAAASWPPELLTPRHEYELRLDAGQVTAGLLAEMQRLEPFGQGNPRPLVRVGPLRLSAPPRLFGNGHLAARAVSEGGDGGAVELVGWGWQPRAAALGGSFEVLACLEHDAFRGPVLRLVDSRPA
jgi:single-stranded-DNA-specific exonuclease